MIEVIILLVFNFLLLCCCGFFIYLDKLLLHVVDCVFFFFFKQKTAYDMRISDWSSDVCSSDLRLRVARRDEAAADARQPRLRQPPRRHRAGARGARDRRVRRAAVHRRRAHARRRAHRRRAARSTRRPGADAVQADRPYLLDEGSRPPGVRPAAAALRTPLAAAVDGGAPGPRHQRPAADDRRRRAAAPDHFAEVEAAEGVRGHACATVARRRGGHLRQRYADARIGEDATAAGAAGGAVAHARASLCTKAATTRCGGCSPRSATTSKRCIAAASAGWSSARW